MTIISAVLVPMDSTLIIDSMNILLGKKCLSLCILFGLSCDPPMPFIFLYLLILSSSPSSGHISTDFPIFTRWVRVLVVQVHHLLHPLHSLEFLLVRMITYHGATNFYDLNPVPSTNYSPVRPNPLYKNATKGGKDIERRRSKSNDGMEYIIPRLQQQWPSNTF